MDNLKKTITLFALIFGTLTLFHAQPRKIVDSLTLELIEHPQQDTVRAKIIMNIVYYTGQYDYQASYKWSQELFELSSKLKYDNGMAYSAYQNVTFYQNREEWEKMSQSLHLAESLYTKLDKPLYLIGLKEAKGRYFAKTGEFENSLQTMFECLDYYSNNNQHERVIGTYMAIARLYKEMERPHDVEENLLIAIQLAKVYNAENLLLIAYQNLSSYYIERYNFDKAEPIVKLLFELQQKLQHAQLDAFFNFQLATLYLHKKNFSEAIKLINLSLEEFEKHGDTLNWAIGQLTKSNVFWEMGDHEHALELLQLGLNIIGDREISPTLKGDFHMHLYERYKELGRFEEALEAFEKANEYKSGIFSVETANKISELREQFESEKKEQENQILRDQNQLKELKIQRKNFQVLLLIAGALLLILTGYLYFRIKTSIHNQTTSDLEQKFLRIQMNPHFIFNALTSIQSYVYKNEPREAGKYLSSFAKLMRSILDNSKANYVSLNQEIEWLNNYVNLQILRFENEVNYHLEIDKNIDLDNTKIPPMLTQPFIENAFEHGFRNLKHRGEITVSFSKNELNRLLVCVEDNGAGFQSDGMELKKSEHKSMAISITKERLKQLNKSTRKPIAFTVHSVPSVGTKVEFEIPIINEL